ncbi:hypothetical protein INT48_002594 [Thamnidium elegans]|uniref:Uncharacterized protein n=1 Tax=Thamnidium elegans TaxID=101142 RepID=A0A8H7W0C5_9FUNG|nr:hypothetical protein INT48_002594 [Thamnidium elegans]
MISKEEASCIFYCKEFKEENVKTCMQNIQLSPDVDLCYKLYKSKEVLEQVQVQVEEAVNSDKKEDLILVSVAENVLDVLPNHDSKIHATKKDSYKIIGRSSAKQQFLKRDLKNEDDILPALNDVHGNTVYLLQFLKENNKICVIAIEYAGLITKMTDLKNLLRDNASLKKITTDQYFYDNQFKYLNSVQLLDNIDDLKLFNCRSASKQRSK